MKLIETITVGSGGSASIVFNSIPQTFTDLYIVFSLRGTTSANSVEIRLFPNGVGGSDRLLYAFGSGGAGTNTSSNLRGVTSAATASSNTFGSGGVYLPNYTLTGAKNISMTSLSENNNSVADLYVLGGTSTTTAAVTSFTISPVSGNFAQYSSASLYGITKGSDGIVTVS